VKRPGIVVWAAAALAVVGCAEDKPPGAMPGPAAEVDAGSPDAARDAGRREVSAPVAPNGPMAPWASADVGPVGTFKAEVRSSLTQLTVRATGMDVGGTADSFHFVSNKAHGDFELVARVRSLQMVAPDSKAGIMVRASADPAAPNVFLTVLADPMRGGQFQVRPTAGAATTVFGPDPGVRAGQWLRLTRKGRTLTAARSSSRLDWIKVGSADVDLPAEVFVGLAVASRSATAPTTAEFDALRVADFPGQAATRDFSLDEIAVMGASATWNAGTLTLTGLGEPLSLLMESGVVAAASVSGNHVFTARLAGFTHSDPNARVGLVIRQGPPVAFSRGQPAVLLSVNAGMTATFQSRAANNLMATVAPPRADQKAPLWLRLERIEQAGPPLSSRFVGSISTDGVQWSPLGEARFALPEPFLIGFHASSNGSTTPVTATFTDVTLTPVTTAPTPPPPDAARPPDAPTDGGPG
jgi:regulation of enolase protein 1 (concanavalin A-like superfamily)